MTGDPVLFRGGPIRTMAGDDLAATPPEALLVEQARVRAVGTLSDVRAAASRAPREIDLDGRVLLPGFVDAHAHTLLHGCALDWVDLSGTTSIDDIVTALRVRARNTPGRPVHGYGYDQSRLRDKRHPTKSDLDRVATAVPVRIQHASGHGYAVNSLVLRQADIHRDTPTPQGGRIDRDAEGTPTGVVFDAACDLLTGTDGVKVGDHGPNFHQPMPPVEVARLFELGQRSLLAAGITTVCDAQVTELEMGAYLRARDEGTLTIRAHLLMLSSAIEHLVGIGLGARLGDARLRLSGVKVYADGSVIARTARLGGNGCCETPSPVGHLYHEPSELTTLIMTAHRLGLPVATHAQGEMPIGLVLDAVARARAIERKPHLIHRIEHCGFPTGEQLRRMAELDVVPVPQPMQVHVFCDSLLDEFGAGGGRLYPCGAFERCGLPVVVSSDAPVTQPAPLRAVSAAITRATTGGRLAGGAALRASKAAALLGTNRTPARLLGAHDIGTLAVGARADMVLLDTDPVTADPDQLALAGVTETWVAGTPVWISQEGTS